MSLFIQDLAETDILRHIERYADQGLPHIANRFRAAVLSAIDALMAMPEAGAPMPSDNPAFGGLRARPVKSFDGFQIYYLPAGERLTVLRVLHGKRDIGIVLEAPDLHTP